MRHNPYAWTSASPELLQDPEVLNCSILLHRDSSGDWDGSWLRFGPPHHWSKVPRHFFANKQIVMGLIPTDAIEGLRLADPTLQADKEVVLFALQHAPKMCRENFSGRQDPPYSPFHFAHSALQDDIEVAKVALQASVAALHKVGPSVRAFILANPSILDSLAANPQLHFSAELDGKLPIQYPGLVWLKTAIESRRAVYSRHLAGVDLAPTAAAASALDEQHLATGVDLSPTAAAWSALPQENLALGVDLAPAAAAGSAETQENFAIGVDLAPGAAAGSAETHVNLAIGVDLAPTAAAGSAFQEPVFSIGKGWQPKGWQTKGKGKGDGKGRWEHFPMGVKLSYEYD